MTNEIKTKLRFTMKNFGIAIRDCDNLHHRRSCLKWATLLNELRQDSNTNPIALQLTWNKFKSL